MLNLFVYLLVYIVKKKEEYFLLKNSTIPITNVIKTPTITLLTGNLSIRLVIKLITTIDSIKELP